MERRTDCRGGLHHRFVCHVQPHRQRVRSSGPELHGHGKDDTVSDEPKQMLMPDYIRDVSKVGLKIKLIQDADAIGETAKVYDEWRAASGRTQMPGILKCFGYRPDFLRQVMQFSNTVHFSEGHLSRRNKEMIASYVSYLNRCPY